MTNKIFFPPEWYPQDAIMVSWPNNQTDWCFNLDEAIKAYVDIIIRISEYEMVLVLCHNKEEVKKYLAKANLANIFFIEENYNDTWARDFGPITVFDNERPKLLDFQFNGWGNKYDATLDNAITKRLYDSSVFSKDTGYSNMLDFVLEGGSIDTDGNGTLLTTSQCLLSDQRNPKYTKRQIENKLKENLGVKNILWLNHGDIEGDDTDGHIDTLAKFCDEKTVVYASCENKGAPHFIELKKMEEELLQLTNTNNEKYGLVKLPLPEPIFNEKGNMLPATYVNFLITNEAVLVPSYRDKKDEEVKTILESIFNEKRIIMIDCVPLIQQYGSLHCITMQVPKTILKNPAL